jgi:hypothetical protein
MENFLQKCVMAVAFVMAVFCFSYWYMEKESARMSITKDEPTPAPVIKYEIVGPPLIKEVKVKTPPPVPPPAQVKPVVWWTLARVTEFTDVGVKAIPIGSRVTVIKNEGGMVTIFDGKNTITTKEENITSDTSELTKRKIIRITTTK